MIIKFDPKKEGMDHISIFFEHTKKCIITFDEKRFRHHTRLVADSGSVFEHLIQDRTADKLEAIRKACLQMDDIDVSYKEQELAKLPRRILTIIKDEKFNDPPTDGGS